MNDIEPINYEKYKTRYDVTVNKLNKQYSYQHLTETDIEIFNYDINVNSKDYKSVDEKILKKALWLKIHEEAVQEAFMFYIMNNYKELHDSFKEQFMLPLQEELGISIRITPNELENE